MVAGSPCRIALASSSISCGVKPERAATTGSTFITMAGPLMVFSMPSFTSATPLIFLILSATLGAHSFSSVGIGGEQLDLDRLGRTGQVADHVLQHLDEFDVELRILLVDLRAHFGNDLVDAAVAIALQPHGEVAGVRFGDGREAELQSGAARSALHFRRRCQNLLDAQQHLVGVGQRRSGGHQVIENESAFVHLRKQVAAQRAIAQKYEAADQHQRSPAPSARGCASTKRSARS